MQKITKLRLWKILTGLICTLATISSAQAIEVKPLWSVGTGVMREELQVDIEYLQNAGTDPNQFGIHFNNIQYNTIFFNTGVIFNNIAEVKLGILHGVGSKNSQLKIKTTEDDYDFAIEGTKPRTTELNLGLITHIPVTDRITLHPEITHSMGSSKLGRFKADLESMQSPPNRFPFEWDASYSHYTTRIGNNISFEICESCELTYGIFYNWKHLKNKKQFIADPMEIVDVSLQDLLVRGFEHKFEGKYIITQNWILSANFSFKKLCGKNHNKTKAHPSDLLGGNEISKVTTKNKSWSSEIKISHKL